MLRRQSTLKKSHRVLQTFPRMGGEFSFMSFTHEKLSEKSLELLFQKAANEVLRIENKLTDFRDSPFNQINKYAGIKPIQVDDEIFSIIKASLALSKETQGDFDISYASLGHIWREAKKEGRSLSTEQRERAKSFIDYRLIETSEKNQTIFLPHKEMRIGLGGIGKGYAVDRAYDILRSEGLENFYINGSGDVRVHSGKNAPRKWKIGIRNPFSSVRSQMAGAIQLGQGAVATSGSYVHQVRHDSGDHAGPLDHHIIHHQTGMSVDELVSVTIIGQKAQYCDAWGTILMNRGKAQAIESLNRKEMIGLVIGKEGRVSLSQKALNYFGL